MLRSTAQIESGSGRNRKKTNRQRRPVQRERSHTKRKPKSHRAGPRRLNDVSVGACAGAGIGTMRLHPVHEPEDDEEKRGAFEVEPLDAGFAKNVRCEQIADAKSQQSDKRARKVLPRKHLVHRRCGG